MSEEKRVSSKQARKDTAKYLRIRRYFEVKRNTGKTQATDVPEDAVEMASTSAEPCDAVTVNWETVEGSVHEEPVVVVPKSAKRRKRPRPKQSVVVDEKSLEADLKEMIDFNSPPASVVSLIEETAKKVCEGVRSAHRQIIASLKFANSDDTDDSDTETNLNRALTSLAKDFIGQCCLYEEASLFLRNYKQLMRLVIQAAGDEYAEEIKRLEEEYRVATQQAVEEAMKRFWCINCGLEAKYFCCFKGQYCSRECQLCHLDKHKSVCVQLSDYPDKTEVTGLLPSLQHAPSDSVPPGSLQDLKLFLINTPVPDVPANVLEIATAESLHPFVPAALNRDHMYL